MSLHGCFPGLLHPSADRVCCCGHCRHYYSWVLAMLISQQNQLLHTFPRTIFSVKNFTVGGYSCMPDKIPIDRRISYPLASNLYKVTPPPALTSMHAACTLLNGPRHGCARCEAPSQPTAPSMYGLEQARSCLAVQSVTP